MIKEKIKAYCLELGLDTIGFIKCRTFDELVPYYKERERRKLQNEFETRDLEVRINPAHYMIEAKTIISIAFPYQYEAMEIDNGFSTYTKRLDYHKVVSSYLEKIAAYIEELGGKAKCFVDSNTLPERYIAYLAGIGFIGKNNMLITKKYGSYVFLGEIITDLEIDCGDMQRYEDLKKHVPCGECDNCLKECPTKSIHKGYCNPNICLSYITQKKQITKKEMNLLKGNIFGCDFCQLKCPYNESAEKSSLKDFDVLDYMMDDVSVFAEMNNAFFKEKISRTSCGWRGKNVIKRNAIIHRYQKGLDISRYKGDSPYINGYIDQLLEKEEK